MCFLTIAFAFGILISKYRTLTLTVNTIPATIVSELEGVIESIKPTIKGSQLVLAQVNIYKLASCTPMPSKVRVSLPASYTRSISLNDKIKITAKLYKPQKSVLPGSYDFGFYAYFAKIGATGYALAEPKILSHSQSTYKNVIYKIRKAIYDRLISSMGTVKGNFAAAILLGESKALNKKLMQDMRRSGISHILCVSGLHLSLVAMILFIASRCLLNLSDFIAHNLNIKQLASIISLIGSYFYLELTGMQIAATRAFIMTALFILAIMLERTPHPLRSLALAAGIILSLNPEYIFHPSFQLSFIAVLSLVSGYELYVRHKWIMGESKGILVKIKFYLYSNIYSSFLAGIVTAPVVINQFYVFSTYSVLANLIAVPIMSFFLMPLAIITICLAPMGLDLPFLKLLEYFIGIILTTASFTNQLPGSVGYFGYITPASILVFIFGFLWICFWQTIWRFLGLLIMGTSFILMIYSPKPDLIIDTNLNALGVKNQQNKLEIYANQMPEFNSKYWANWFGQPDSKILPLPQPTVLKILDDMSKANSKQSLALLDKASCLNQLYLDKEILVPAGTMIVFCGSGKPQVVHIKDFTQRFLSSKN